MSFLTFVALVAIFWATYYLQNKKNKTQKGKLIAIGIIILVFIYAVNHNPTSSELSTANIISNVENAVKSFFINLLEEYIIPAIIVYLGYQYKYKISGPYAGRNLPMRWQDWFMILCPFVNWLGVLYSVVMILIDIIVKIADVFEDRR